MRLRFLPFLMLAIVGVVTFALSGRWLDPWLWAWLLAWSACLAYAVSVMSEDLPRERFPRREKSAGDVALRLIRLVGLAHIMRGALDGGRWHLFPVPASLRVAGLVGMAFSGAMVF